MNIETMTTVQALTINEALTGKDIVAQARTGTGKTMAFLLPLIQRILQDDPNLVEGSHRPRNNGSDIRAILISPTRELAEQIAVEAEKLVRGTGIKVQRAVGGTQKHMHLQLIHRNGCHIMVGTPGRLKDILSDSSTGIQAPRLSAVVLDEADRLMDQGFWPEIQEIQHCLPRPEEHDRQTLLFSATMPQEVVRLARSTMKRDLHFVQTVQENETPTHERVPQKLVAVPGFENQLPALLELLQREAQRRSSPEERPFKAIVYFAATAEVVLADKILYNVLRTSGRQIWGDNPIHVGCIHGQMPQMRRTRAADSFRRAKSAVLMSTDVTARGLDFPNVTHVIQIGMPRDRESYVHRIGRTGRAGAEGEGWLILPYYALNQGRKMLHTMPIKRDETLLSSKVEFSIDADGSAKEPPMPQEVKPIFDLIREAASHPSNSDVQNGAYTGVFGNTSWWQDKRKLVEHVNRWAAVEWNRTDTPPVSPKLIRNLGLTGIPGLNVRESSFGDDRRRGPPRAGFGRSDFGRSDFGRGGSGRSSNYGRESSSYDRESRGGYRDRQASSRHESGFGRGSYGSRDSY